MINLDVFVVSTPQKQGPSTPVRPNGSVPPLLPDWTSPGSTARLQVHAKVIFSQRQQMWLDLVTLLISIHS